MRNVSTFRNSLTFLIFVQTTEEEGVILQDYNIDTWICDCSFSFNIIFLFNFTQTLTNGRR